MLIEDLIKGARELFGYSPALVAAALKRTGRKKFSLDEAKKTVREFARSVSD